MPSDERSEKLKLVVDPDEGSIFGTDAAESGPDPDRDGGRRRDGAGPDPEAYEISEDPPRRYATGLVSGQREEPIEASEDLEAPPGRRVLPMAAAAIVLIGFAGIVWYAYNWGAGEVETASLPVIVADPEPIKSRPESPGGLDVPHQDKLVLNQASPDPETPQVERLLPPPEVPKPPKAEVAALAPPIETAAGPATEAPATSPPPASPAASSVGASQDASTDESSVAPGAVPIEPVESVTQIAELPETPPEPPQVAPQPPAEPEVKIQSAQPEPAATASEPAPAPPTKTATQTAARTPATGPYVIQLAALKSREATSGAWERLQSKYPTLLGDKDLTVQSVDLGERGVFFRLQAGYFPDRAAAGALCTALKGRGQDCLVVKR